VRPLLCLADDLTGAASLAACLGEMGAGGAVSFEAVSEPVAGAETPATQASSRPSVVDLAMRDAGEGVIRERIARALAGRDPAGYVSLRIDSTGLSPTGAYLAAALSSLGSSARAVVMPVHPAAGRSFVGGDLRLDGDHVRRLHIEGVEAAVVGLDAVRSGNLRTTIEERLSSARVVVIEGSSELDVRRVAQAIASLSGPLVIVDPGPLTVALSLYTSPTPRVLAIMGSTSELSARQVEKARMRAGVEVVAVHVEVALAGEDACRAAVDDAVGKLERAQTVCVVTAGEVPFRERTEVSELLGSTAASVIGRTRVDGLYLSGGHVAKAVCDALGARGLRDLTETEALASLGRLEGGTAPGLPVALKGGQVGDDSTMIGMLERLTRLAAGSLSHGAESPSG
jgi:D-threonate/D-erythronate kinase